MIYKVYRDVAAIVLLPVILVVVALLLTDASFEQLEQFIRSYSGTLISLGTLILVSFLAIYAAHLASQSAEKTAKNNRRIQSELQIAAFRQAWISGMRDDISELVRLSFHSPDEEAVVRAYQLSMKIEMRLNTKEHLAKQVSECLLKIASADGNDAAHTQAITELVLVAKEYLKNEWSRLKSDIEKAQLLGEKF